jgi:hypothetical protein
MAQAPGRTGGIGQQVSAMAKRPMPAAPTTGGGYPLHRDVSSPAPLAMRKGGMVSSTEAVKTTNSAAPTTSGPSWKPAKPAGGGNYGKLVSAAAHARNAARKAARPANAAASLPATRAVPTSTSGTATVPAVPSSNSFNIGALPYETTASAFSKGGMVKKRGWGCARTGRK